MDVQLTWSEIQLGALVGATRHLLRLRDGAQNRYTNGAPLNGWQIHVEGALGEMAVAKAFDLFWSGDVGQPGRGDIGNSLEVRTTATLDGHLILHPSDPDDSIYWLVVGKNGAYTIVGWIQGIDGKQEWYWRTRGVRHPAYFVPSESLHPPDDQSWLMIVAG